MSRNYEKPSGSRCKKAGRRGKRGGRVMLGENSCDERTGWSAGCVSTAVWRMELLTENREEVRRHGIELLGSFKYGLERLYWWLTSH